MSFLIFASSLAAQAHEGQKRKYTGRPYVEHPFRVASRVIEHLKSMTQKYPWHKEAIVAAAMLHDVLEDTQATEQDVFSNSCQETLGFVKWLTNPSKDRTDLNRAERKEMDREHLRKAPWEVKLIKLVDRIDNLGEMGDAPWDFKLKYAQESILLLDAIGDADAELAAELLKLAERRKKEAALP